MKGAMKTTADLLDLHERVTTEARGLMKAKNEDYAHGVDPFRNFRRHGSFGVLVRLSDKLARLDSFEERGEFSVKGEAIEDTVKDIINYATIYLALKLEADQNARPTDPALPVILDHELASRLREGRPGGAIPEHELQEFRGAR